MNNRVLTKLTEIFGNIRKNISLKPKGVNQKAYLKMPEEKIL